MTPPLSELDQLARQVGIREPEQPPIERARVPSPLLPFLLVGSALAAALILCFVARWCTAS